MAQLPDGIHPAISHAMTSLLVANCDRAEIACDSGVNYVNGSVLTSPSWIGYEVNNRSTPDPTCYLLWEIDIFCSLYGPILKDLGYVYKTQMICDCDYKRSLCIYLTAAVLDYRTTSAPDETESAVVIDGVSYLRSAKFMQMLYKSPEAWRERFNLHYHQVWPNIFGWGHLFSAEDKLAAFSTGGLLGDHYQFISGIRLRAITMGLCSPGSLIWVPGMFAQEPLSYYVLQSRKKYLEKRGWARQYVRDFSNDTFEMMFWRRVLGPIIELCKHIGYTVNCDPGDHKCTDRCERYCAGPRNVCIEYSDRLLEKDDVYHQIVHVLNRYCVPMSGVNYETRLSDQPRFKYRFGNATIPLTSREESDVVNLMEDFIMEILDKMHYIPGMAGYDRQNNLNLVLHILRSRILWQGRMNPDSYPRYRRIIRKEIIEAISRGESPTVVRPVVASYIHWGGIINADGTSSRVIPVEMQDRIWAEETKKYTG